MAAARRTRRRARVSRGRTRRSPRGGRRATGRVCTRRRRAFGPSLGGRTPRPFRSSARSPGRSRSPGPGTGPGPGPGPRPAPRVSLTLAVVAVPPAVGPTGPLVAAVAVAVATRRRRAARPYARSSSRRSSPYRRTPSSFCVGRFSNPGFAPFLGLASLPRPTPPPNRRGRRPGTARPRSASTTTRRPSIVRPFAPRYAAFMSSSLAYSTNAYPQWRVVSFSSSAFFRAFRTTGIVTVRTSPNVSNSRRSASSSASYASRPTNNVLYGSVSFGMFTSVLGSYVSDCARSFAACLCFFSLAMRAKRASLVSRPTGTRAEVSAGFSSPRFGSSNSPTSAAMPVNARVFFGRAGGGMYSSGGRGSNRASKLGGKPVGCCGPPPLPVPPRGGSCVVGRGAPPPYPPPGGGA